MRYILVLLLLSSCATERSVNKWLIKHPDDLVQVCDSVFPKRELIDTIYDGIRHTYPKGIDSEAYMKAYAQIWDYADSLESVLQGIDTTHRITIRDSLRKVFIYRFRFKYDTIRITRYQFDSLKVKILTDSLETKNTEIKYLKKIAADRINYLLGILSIVGTFMSYQLRQKFKKKSK